MFKIDANDLVLVNGYVAVIPGRPNANIVRTEKKYDRHAVGKVLFWMLIGGTIDRLLHECAVGIYQETVAKRHIIVTCIDAVSIPLVAHIITIL